MTQNANQTPNVLLDYLVSQAAVQKDWFGFLQQRIAGVDLAYRIAAQHADKMSPQDVVTYVKQLNDEIYEKILRAK
jgi:hypothetical protein